MRVPVRFYIYLVAVLVLGFALDKDVTCALR